MSLFTLTDVGTAFKTNRLTPAIQTFLAGTTFDDSYLLQQLQAAEASVSHRLKVYLEPTKVFPFSPQQNDIDALNGEAWDEEPGYDYDAAFFQAESWGYIVTRHRPVIGIDFVRLVYPNPTTTFYQIPNDWIRLDKKYGHIRFVPASGTFNAPLNAFLMQAMGGGSTIPSMIQIQYDSGLQNVKTDPRWADLLDVIYKEAVLNLLDGAYVPQSASISADGLSQQVSLDMQKLRESCDFKLFGPKGANGGLWTTIHGVAGTMMGTLA